MNILSSRVDLDMVGSRCNHGNLKKGFKRIDECYLCGRRILGHGCMQHITQMALDHL